jgi:hypothetical protein
MGDPRGDDGIFGGDENALSAIRIGTVSSSQVIAPL